MIIGIGNDLVDIRRIERALERHSSRFEKRCFSEHEIQKAKSREKTGMSAHALAKRFAAKEACSKALGTGFLGDVNMKDICVAEDESGRPFLELSGGALKKLQQLTPKGSGAKMHLSLTDEPPYAQAFVVIEAC